MSTVEASKQEHLESINVTPVFGITVVNILYFLLFSINISHNMGIKHFT